MVLIISLSYWFPLSLTICDGIPYLHIHPTMALPAVIAVVSFVATSSTSLLKVSMIVMMLLYPYHLLFF